MKKKIVYMSFQSEKSFTVIAEFEFRFNVILIHQHKFLVVINVTVVTAESIM